MLTGGGLEDEVIRTIAAQLPQRSKVAEQRPQQGHNTVGFGLRAIDNLIATKRRLDRNLALDIAPAHS
jgi:hypothetical protein